MQEIQIGGLVSFTTIDYPGKLAAVLFLRGCPLRCRYCSNRHLLDVGDGEYDPEKVFQWIQTRVGKLEGIVFSGGEALMQGDALINYMQRVRDLGFAIGLHTNGFYPSTLRRALSVIDWIGLDFKATGQNYQKLTGNEIAYKHMLESLNIWMETGKDIEVRITCDPRFVSKENLMQIAAFLAEKNVPNIAIQKYIPHFDDEKNETSAEMREQFFNDPDLRNKINTQFRSVIWRE